MRLACKALKVPSAAATAMLTVYGGSLRLPPRPRRSHTALTPPGTPTPRHAPPRPAPESRSSSKGEAECLSRVRLFGISAWDLDLHHVLTRATGYWLNVHINICNTYYMKFRKGREQPITTGVLKLVRWPFPESSPDKTPSSQELLFSQTVCGGGI